METSQTPSLDPWADWLVQGRQRGLPEREAKRMARDLTRARDRVLRGARVRRGARMLDIGAGTGLLALELQRRAGPTGSILALDLSADALRQCQQQAVTGAEAALLHAVQADATHLPVADASFDAAVTRSVLLYVADKPGAIREIFRVLRPGGWACVSEPINRAHQYLGGINNPELAAVQPAHGRILSYLRERAVYDETMRGFDERDLVRWFVEAGFQSVELVYWHQYARRRRRKEETHASLRSRPNPFRLSYEEGAQAVLGDGAEAHLERYAQILLAQPSIAVRAIATVTAQR